MATPHIEKNSIVDQTSIWANSAHSDLVLLRRLSAIYHLQGRKKDGQVTTGR